MKNVRRKSAARRERARVYARAVKQRSERREEMRLATVGLLPVPIVRRELYAMRDAVVSRAYITHI